MSGMGMSVHAPTYQLWYQYAAQLCVLLVVT